MRFLHTSDWHLGISFKGRGATEDQRYFVDQIIKTINEKNIDAVIVAGDIFDRSMASGDTVSFYDDIMTEIVVKNDTQVICVAGNHDSAERLSQCSQLLKRAGLFVCGSLNRDFTVVSYEDVDVYLLPWISVDKVRAVFPERNDEIISMEDAYKVVLSEMRKTFNMNKKHFLVSHAFITGAVTSTSDRAAEVGTATAISKGVFEGFDYVALGHIHKPQIIEDSIRYCGTPMPYSFGKEEQQIKGVVIIDTNDMSKEFVPLKLLHKRTTIRGTYDELDKGKYDEDIKNGFVRLEVTDQYIGPDTFSYFSEKYPLLLEMRGLDYSEANAGITLTINELNEKADDPEEIFQCFCRENSIPYTDDNIALFREVLEEISKEVE